MAYPDLSGLTAMHGAAFAAHIIGGAVFVYLAYWAHEQTLPVLPWIIPLGFTALVITGDWTAAFDHGIRLGYTGILSAAAGSVLGAGLSVATFRPEPPRSKQSPSEFEI